MAGSVRSASWSGKNQAVELEPIQLVAPDGTPTAETRYRRDLPPESLGWLYEMMAVTRALDAEFGGLLEAFGIAVGGAVDDHERRARRDRDTAEVGRHPRQPEVTFHGALDP